MKMPAIWSKEGCLVRRKKVLLVVFLVVVLFFGRGVPGTWCLVKKIEGFGEDPWWLETEGVLKKEEVVGSVSREWSLFLERKRRPRSKVSRWFPTLVQPLGKEFTPGKRYRG